MAMAMATAMARPPRARLRNERGRIVPKTMGTTFAKILWASAALAVATFSASTSIRAAALHGEAGLLTGMYAADSVLLVRAEQIALSANPNHKLNHSITEAARSTLRRVPLNASVISFLGVAAAGPNGTSLKTDQLMRLAGKVARRDSLSQMWALEASSAAGDVDGAVAHYHALLSTNPGLHQVLFGVLTPALDFPEIQKAMRPYLTNQAPWMPAFLTFAAKQGNLDSWLAMVGQNHSSLRSDRYAPANGLIVSRLAQEGQSDQAIAFAEKVFPGFDGKKFMQFEISAATTDPRLGDLSWRLGGQPGAEASLAENGDVLISIEPAVRAAALSRSLVVKPGASLAFTYSLSAEESSRGAAFKWAISCMNAPDKAKHVAPWEQVAIVGPETKLGTIKFPGIPGCSLLDIKLMALGAERQIGSVAKLSSLLISQ